MKQFIKWCCFSSLYFTILFSQPIFDLPDDSASFGMLICDYETSAFEEGTVLNVPLCNGCDSTGFPFDVLYQGPGDLGWIQFNYTETGDTIFYATIVWMGQGSITYPTNFLPADSFSVEAGNASDPDTIYFWNSWGDTNIVNETFLQSAAAAYENIRHLSVVHQFADYPYKIIAFMYTPTVGATDLAVAKWIFFLYRNPEEISISDENPIPQKFKLHQPYPNPFNPTTTIRFNIPVETQHVGNPDGVGATSLHVFDITGRLVETLVDSKLQAGEHEIVWNAFGIPSGVYFIRLESGEFVENRKILLLK